MCYIVHPSDTAPALAALGAVCRISGPTSSRSVAVESFHVPPTEDPQRETVLAPDEILTEIILPAPPTWAPFVLPQGADARRLGLRPRRRRPRRRLRWRHGAVGAGLPLRRSAGAVEIAGDRGGDRRHDSRRAPPSTRPPQPPSRAPSRSRRTATRSRSSRA